MNKMSRLLTFVSRTLLVLLVATCLTSHLAARLPARFASSLGGDGSGRVAKFSGGTVEYSVISAPSLKAIESSGYYAFVATFKVNFDEAEVSRKYSLTFHFDGDVDDDTTLLYPGTVGSVSASGKVDTSTSASELGFSGGSFSSGNAYFSLGIGSESSTLRSVTGSKHSVQLVTDQPIAMAGESHYFKIVFFEYITVNKSLVSAGNEILHMLTDIVVEQVD